MIVINFSHPLTATQKEQIEKLSNDTINQVQRISVQFDHACSFAEQAQELINHIDLDAQAWQTQPVLVNPPAYSFVAVTLFAELHGRMGYFPPIIRIRPVPESIPVEYEVAEIIDLQTVRDKARAKR